MSRSCAANESFANNRCKHVQNRATLGEFQLVMGKIISYEWFQLVMEKRNSVTEINFPLLVCWSVWQGKWHKRGGKGHIDCCRQMITRTVEWFSKLGYGTSKPVVSCGFPIKRWPMNSMIRCHDGMGQQSTANTYSNNNIQKQAGQHPKTSNTFKNINDLFFLIASRVDFPPLMLTKLDPACQGRLQSRSGACMVAWAWRGLMRLALFAGS